MSKSKLRANKWDDTMTEYSIKTMVDPVTNFGKVTISAGYDNIATNIALNPGDGARLPNPSTDGGSFNLAW